MPLEKTTYLVLNRLIIKKMIRVLILIYITLIVSNINIQKANGQTFEIIWSGDKFLFYDTKDLTKIDFTVRNLSTESAGLWNKTENDIVKKITISKPDETLSQTGCILFKKSPDPSEAKSLLEQMGINEFIVNSKKIITKTIITEAEAHDLAMSFVFKDIPFTQACNDTTKIEHYDFQIYYAGSKLQYMWGKNYPKYLYDGYVAKYTELLENSKIRREKFINNTVNK